MPLAVEPYTVPALTIVEATLPAVTIPYVPPSMRPKVLLSIVPPASSRMLTREYPAMKPAFVTVALSLFPAYTPK